MELLQGLSDSEPKENLYNVYRELAKSKMENGKQLLPTVPNPDQFESSLELMEKAFEGFGLLHDEQSTRLLLVKSDLGVAYMFAFKELAKIGVAKKNYADQAVRILEETYQSFRKVAGPASEDALATYTNLANAFLKQGDAESAVTANLEVIERWEALLKQKQSETATRSDSETAGRDISEIKRIRFRLSIARNNLGEAYHRQGKFAMAITAYREAMAEWYELLSTSHSNLMDTVRLLLECLLEDNQNQAAREFFNEVFKKTQLENRDSARKQAEKDLALIRERLMKKYGIDDSWQVATTVEHPDKND
jgi:tetratricopeptide (TPR) repeat protein